jgi:molybdopterin molybdotransferase
LDARAASSATEAIPVTEAADRVLAEAMPATGDTAAVPRAGENGYAVRATDCDGASAYNPLLLTLQEPGVSVLIAGAASPIATGWTLPLEADAVLPLEAAQPSGLHALEVLAPVATGAGVDRPASQPVSLPLGHRTRPQDIGWLIAQGVTQIPVRSRPRVGLVVAGAKSGPDVLTPLLQALLHRDEALIDPIPVNNADEASLTAALTAPAIARCDLVLLAGRSGAGLDDTAAPALIAAGGNLALHGLALRPGGASGLRTLPGATPSEGIPILLPWGRTPSEGIPILLLPGDPLACLVAYDMLAARLVRRLAGLPTTLPYPVAEYALARKIVSGIGLLEVVPVRLIGGQAQPIGSEAGLAGAVQADGFVVVAEASEGHRAGTRVRVHLYRSRHSATTQDINP